MKALTLADHAEAWHSENGGTVPPRDTPERQTMYESWHTFAFEHFPKSAPNEWTQGDYKQAFGRIRRAKHAKHFTPQGLGKTKLIYAGAP